MSWLDDLLNNTPQTPKGLLAPPDQLPANGLLGSPLVAATGLLGQAPSMPNYAAMLNPVPQMPPDRGLPGAADQVPQSFGWDQIFKARQTLNDHLYPLPSKPDLSTIDLTNTGADSGQGGWTVQRLAGSSTNPQPMLFADRVAAASTGLGVAQTIPSGNTQPSGHDFNVHSLICTKGDPGCSPQAVADAMLYDQFPFQNGVKTGPDADGDVLPFLPGHYGDIKVEQIMSPDGSTAWSNVTKPTHIFYNGRVDRKMVMDGPRIYVDSHGYGGNANAFLGELNQLIGPPLFEGVDSSLRARVRGPVYELGNLGKIPLGGTL